MASYVWGRLSGPADKLAADGQRYPFVYQKASIRTVSRNTSGHTDFAFQRTIKPMVGKEVTFQAERFEHWVSERTVVEEAGS